MIKSKLHILYYLSVYIMLMGIAGYLRTSAMMPLYLNGSIALLTTIFGYLYYTKKSIWSNVVLIWVILNFVMYSYMTLFGVQAHPNPTVGTYLIFGSLAVFSGVTVVYLINEMRSEKENR